MKAYQVLGFVFRVCQVVQHGGIAVRVGFVLAIFMLGPKHLAKISERFIYRQIAPAFGCYIITEPLVEKLMRDGAAAIIIISVYQFAVGALYIVAMQGSGGIFHRAAYVITYYNLCVLVPRIVNA